MKEVFVLTLQGNGCGYSSEIAVFSCAEKAVSYRQELMKLYDGPGEVLITKVAFDLEIEEY